MSNIFVFGKNPNLRLDFERLGKSIGLKKIIFATSIAESSEFFERTPPQFFHLFFFDLDNFSETESIQIIKELAKLIGIDFAKIVICRSSVTRNFFREASLLNPNRFLTKPFQADTIKKILLDAPTLNISLSSAIPEAKIFEMFGLALTLTLAQHAPRFSGRVNHGFLHATNEIDETSKILLTIENPMNYQSSRLEVVALETSEISKESMENFLKFFAGVENQWHSIISDRHGRKQKLKASSTQNPQGMEPQEFDEFQVELDQNLFSIRLYTNKCITKENTDTNRKIS